MIVFCCFSYFALHCLMDIGLEYNNGKIGKITNNTTIYFPMDQIMIITINKMLYFIIYKRERERNCNRCIRKLKLLTS